MAPELRMNFNCRDKNAKPHAEMLQDLTLRVLKKAGCLARYKAEVVGHSDTPKVEGDVGIKVGKLDGCNSKIPLVIQLPFRHELWRVEVSLRKEDQKKSAAFAHTLRNATTQVCDEERNRREEKAGSAPPAPPKGEGQEPSVPGSKIRKRARRRIVSKLITDEILLCILEKCQDAEGKLSSMEQVSFRKAIASVSDCNVMCAQQYIEKEGLVIAERKSPRRYQVVFTPKAIKLWQDHLELLKAEEKNVQEEAERNSLVGRMMQLTGDASPFLILMERFFALDQKIRNSADEIKAQHAEIAEKEGQIKKLNMEIERCRKKITGAEGLIQHYEQQKKKMLEGIDVERITAIVDEIKKLHEAQ